MYMEGNMYLVYTTVEDTKEEAQGTFCVSVSYELTQMNLCPTGHVHVYIS